MMPTGKEEPLEIQRSKKYCRQEDFLPLFARAGSFTPTIASNPIVMPEEKGEGPLRRPLGMPESEKEGRKVLIGVR